MTMSDYTTKQIGEARESSLSPVAREVQGWLFSPQFLSILQVAQIAGAICAALKEKSLPKAPYEGRTEVYSDASIFVTALVMKVWKLSLGEITRRLKLYPELAVSCGYQPSKTISKSHLSRRLRRLGPLPFLLYFIYLVCQLIREGVIAAKDLVIDSTTVLAWYEDDAEAGWSYAKKFGYKVHTVICRHSMLPLWFFVSPANRHDGPYGKPLLEAVALLYKVTVEVVRADSAYWALEFLNFIVFLGARIAVDYNVRRKNRSIVQRAWMNWWDRRMGKRSAIERFFGIAKRWFGLSQFYGKGLDSFLLHTLLTYCSMLSVALVAVRIGRPDLKLSPKQLLAPC
jgi:hypothetical protein